MSILTADSLIAATTNAGKVKEFAHKFAPLGIRVRSLAEFPGLPPVVEDGKTFMDNAIIKARAIADALGQPALADDSGLVVDALNGAPGVYSARYAGEHATDAQNVDKLLQSLNAIDVESADSGSFSSLSVSLPAGVRVLSRARFVCALVLALPDTNQLFKAEADCPGFIIDVRRGEGGFGYDPVFFLPAFGRTMSELSIEEKQSVSHRGKALELLINQFEH